MKWGIFLLLFLFLVQDLSAQRRSKRRKQVVPVQVVDVIPDYTVGINRKALHENINKEQLALLASDGKADRQMVVSDDRVVNETVTDAVTKRVDWLRYEIETDPKLDNRLKAHYLTGLLDILKFVRTGLRRHEVDAPDIPRIILTYKNMMAADKQKQPLAPILRNQPFDVVQAVMVPVIFKDNPGYPDARAQLILKAASLHPEKALALLKETPDIPQADSIIKIVARKAPQTVYNYAQANNKLSYRIQRISGDPLVENIVAMARNDQKSGQYYFPFLDQIVKGRITFKEVDAAKNDPVKYFRLLVQTKIEYTNRALNRDTAIGFNDLTQRLERKAKDDFVAQINGLHEQPDAIRFRSIQPLKAEELYYVAVLTDGLIYTSSYTNGVYPLMMKKAGNKGDELLKSVGFDHYRKFISQAASYNTLRNFLGSFSNQSETNDLMRSFVSNLEKSSGLEDGVDVADSYASIYETLPQLAADMRENVKRNLERNRSARNKKGIAIYHILDKLFQSADSGSHIDLTKELGIPPVYDLPFSSLTNEKGEVISQVFFYGDQDGRNIFNGFLNMFGGNNWKIDGSNKQWVVIRSAKGKPVSIYANRPLDENKGLDEKAQEALGEYLEENNLNPTVTIHRGHSYYAPATIHFMAPSSKLVFMGSCGGFNLIDSILRKSDDAHIIASKQIGKTSINKPFFLLLTEKLRTGQDIDWIPFWKEFRQKANVNGFEDYIPPYKNLGAIFIKAYKKETGETNM